MSENSGTCLPAGGDSGTAPSQELLSRAAEAAKCAIRAGYFAPTFRLQDLHGGSVALIDLIERGPSIISFYRGLWCSFCDTAIEALAGIEDDTRALGATHVAIGPPPGDDRQRIKLGTFPMPILIDRGLRVSSAYGLTIDLPVDLREHYAKAGYVPPNAAESGKWLVPIPATYLVDRTGRIAMAAIDTDYRNRLEPSQLLSALRSLQRRATA
jgi:peroxiredoxin